MAQDKGICSQGQAQGQQAQAGPGSEAACPHRRMTSLMAEGAFTFCPLRVPVSTKK
jgi:hypothetical protein